MRPSSQQGEDWGCRLSCGRAPYWEFEGKEVEGHLPPHGNHFTYMCYERNDRTTRYSPVYHRLPSTWIPSRLFTFHSYGRFIVWCPAALHCSINGPQQPRRTRESKLSHEDVVIVSGGSAEYDHSGQVAWFSRPLFPAVYGAPVA